METINFDQVNLELSHAGEATELSPSLLLLDKQRITLERNLPKVDFLYRMFDKPCFPRGELCVVGGKAKSGKTFFTSMLMAAGLGTTTLPSLRREGEQPLRILWYDTEQSEQSTQEIMRDRIGHMTKIIPELLDVFNVRSVKMDQRSDMLMEAVRHYHPDLCIIDGVRDLIADINDGVKSEEMVEGLMRLAQEVNCCIVCVIHQNKGAEDRNLRGWIGTELTNKGFEVYCCEKLMPERIFSVEQTYTRKYDIGQLLYFSVDDDGLPVAAEAPERAVAFANGSGNQESKYPPLNSQYLAPYEEGKPKVKLRELFYDMLKNGALPYAELQPRTMALLNCHSSGFWNNLFSQAKQEGIIVNERSSDGRSVWRLPVRQPAAPQQPDIFHPSVIPEAAPF